MMQERVRKTARVTGGLRAHRLHQGLASGREPRGVVLATGIHEGLGSGSGCGLPAPRTAHRPRAHSQGSPGRLSRRSPDSLNASEARAPRAGYFFL